MTASEIVVNGRRVQSLSATDRGLQFGDGLFETLAVVEGRAPLLDFHLARLAAGCRRLGLPEPAVSLREDIVALCTGRERAVLKILQTAGEGERGYRRGPEPRATCILMLSGAPAYPRRYWSEGVDLVLCETRLGVQPALAGLKHLNRLEQVLARRELDVRRAVEGVLLDAEGAVTEAVAGNLFVVRGNELLTPRLDRAGVAGIMRGRILATAAQLGYAAREARLTVEDLRTADELLLCNSLIGLWPVSSFEDVSYARREVSRKLLRWLFQARQCLLPGEVSFDP